MKLCHITLFCGAKTDAPAYTCSGDSSIVGREYGIKQAMSRKKAGASLRSDICIFIIMLLRWGVMGHLPQPQLAVMHEPNIIRHSVEKTYRIEAKKHILFKELEEFEVLIFISCPAEIADPEDASISNRD